MGAFAVLRGPRQQLSHLLERERITLSAAYFGSMMVTLWASMIAHSYVLTILASAAQVCALVSYTFSYVNPGTV